MTREEAVRRIDQAAEEKLTQLDLAGLELEELPPEIGKCTQLETLVLGKKTEDWEFVDGKYIKNTARGITIALKFAIDRPQWQSIRKDARSAAGNEAVREFKFSKYWFNRNSRCDRPTVESDTA